MESQTKNLSQTNSDQNDNTATHHNQAQLEQDPTSNIIPSQNTQNQNPEDLNLLIPANPYEIDPTYQLNELPSALQTDFDAIEHKPWLDEDADITDYFNYGFDEELFKIYQTKVRDNFRDLNREMLIQEYSTKCLDLNNEKINFYLPHEAGG
jgi:hypothetical protein